MLVLSRQRDESLLIGHHMVVTVADVRGEQVGLIVENEIVGGAREGERVRFEHLLALGESITPAEGIAITIMGIRDSKARVAVDAPKSLMVHRKEVWDQIRRENRGRDGPGGAGAPVPR